MINTNKLNEINGDIPTDPPINNKSQPPADQFKSCKPLTKTSPAVLFIMGRLNHYVVDNGDVEVYPSDHLLASTSDSVLYIYNTPIKSIDDD